MITFRKITRKMHTFFQLHYPFVWVISMASLLFIIFLHYQLEYHDRDLIYWKRVLDYCFYELEHFGLIVIMVIVIAKVLFLAVVIGMNSRSLNWFDELTQIEVKKRYANYLFLRLIHDIDDIEERFLRKPTVAEKGTMQNFIKAHEEIRRKIENFRKNARKLITPNEIELSLPIEEVYGIMEEDERTLKKSKFAKMEISADDALIKSLVNP